jgi:hypothetical protein
VVAVGDGYLLAGPAFSERDRERGKKGAERREGERQRRRERVRK